MKKIQFPTSVIASEADILTATNAADQIWKTTRGKQPVYRIIGLVLEEATFAQNPQFTKNHQTEKNKIFVDTYIDGVAIDFKASMNYPNISITPHVYQNIMNGEDKLLACYRHFEGEYLLLGILSTKDFKSKRIIPEAKDNFGKLYYLIYNADIKANRIDVDGLVTI